jgi:hypothetical protein
MADHLAQTPTQSAYPWRATLRTALAFVIGVAPLAPVLWAAATGHDAAAATGWGATALAVCAGITRLMAVPQVNAFLTRIGLGATPNN